MRTSTEQSKAARAQLIHDSIDAKQLREMWIAKAKSDVEAFYFASLTINDILIGKYQAAAGAKSFKTFNQWKEEGFSVKKGEKAFRLWSAPIKAKKEIELVNIDTQEVETGEENYKLWAMCCVFNEFQVEKKEGDHDSTKNANDVVAPIHHEKPVAEIAAAPVFLGNPKTAEKLRTIAEKLTAEIDACFADRLTNTPKRLAQASYARANGERLKRTQKAALALADLHDKGNVSPLLNKLTSKKAIFDLLVAKMEEVPNGYHSYRVDTGVAAINTEEAKALWSLLTEKTPEEKTKEELQRKIEGLQFSNIEGYFPTQGEALEMLVDRANIEDGHVVADTSAGSGHILDAIHSRYKVDIQAYEKNYTLCDILEAKGYNLIRGDFLSVAPSECYDRIVMNPPFERLQDVEHVQHAYQFLKPGGRLTAIMSTSPFFRSDQKSQTFREWFIALGGVVEDMPDGSFKASGTNVATKVIIIDKPIEAEEPTDNNPFVCANYQYKQAAREERYADRATKARTESNQAYSTARKMGDAIPCGQPILIGHHSERCDRNYRNRMSGKYEQACKLSEKAAYYDGKAATIGQGGIASDDPEAINKLKVKLLACEQRQELMKNANRLIRKNDHQGLMALGLAEKEIHELTTPDFANRIGFADYQLSNNNAEIRRIKGRIEELTEVRSQAPINYTHDEFTVYVDDGRVHFDFKGIKPPENIREELKFNTYHFSRYSDTWVRKATGNALGGCHYLIDQLKDIYTNS